MTRRSFSRRHTPQGYDGSRYTSVQLKDLLGKVVQQAHLVQEAQGEELFRFWPEIVGVQIAKMTQPKSFVEGVFTVCVKNSTLLSLLVQKEKPLLLRKLRERFPTVKIKALNFCMG